MASILHLIYGTYCLFALAGIMPVVARLDWIAQQVDMGRKCHVLISNSQDDLKLKVRIVLHNSSDGPMNDAVKRGVTIVLASFREMAIIFSFAVDRGHKHSNGCSEVAIWLHAPHDVAPCIQVSSLHPTETQSDMEASPQTAADLLANARREVKDFTVDRILEMDAAIATVTESVQCAYATVQRTEDSIGQTTRVLSASEGVAASVQKAADEHLKELQTDRERIRKKILGFETQIRTLCAHRDRLKDLQTSADGLTLEELQTKLQAVHVEFALPSSKRARRNEG